MNASHLRNDQDIDLAKLKREISGTKRKVVAFCHIHKTGGNTIKELLLDNFAANSFNVSTPNALSEFCKAVENGLLDADQTYLVYGHRAHLVLPLLNEKIPTYAVTLLRRPFALFGSTYSFNHTRKGRTTLTTQEALKEYRPNRIARFFGAAPKRTSRFFGTDNFQECIKKATDDYMLIGITERIGEMATILCFLFDLPTVDYQSKNVTHPANYVETDPSITVQFLKDNELDRLVYDYFDALESRLFRHCLMASDGAEVSFETGAATFNKPIQKNRNLKENNDKFSLLTTGQDIWVEDQQLAIQFFDKSFNGDWSMAGPIIEFLNQVDPEQASRWAEKVVKELSDVNTKRSGELEKRIQSWMRS